MKRASTTAGVWLAGAIAVLIVSAQAVSGELHWSFIPLGPVKVPPVQQADWPRNPIDRFVLARLEQDGLAPSPPAPAETLIRRLYFDLTGLPPAPEEIDEILEDSSPSAYEKLVDRLLASPRYGERMAVDWLDLARYADTHGYQADRYRSTWPWRDWVIGALNDNMPFDQFLTWQLAGDLVPAATKPQRLATAFNRLHRQTEEGGSVEEEFRIEYVADRTNTFGTAFLGLTLECCRCHDHKYDPLTQREYYQLFSFFDNIDESGLTSYFTDSMPVPTLLLSDDELDRELAALAEQMDQKEIDLAEFSARPAAQEAFGQWLGSLPRDPLVPGLAAAYPLEAIDNQRVVNTANEELPGEAHDEPRIVPGKMGNSVQFSGENNLVFANVGVFDRTDPFSMSFWIWVPRRIDRAVIVHRSRAWHDAASRGYELLLEEGKLSFALIHMWPGNALRVRTQREIPVGEWVHVVATYDGSSRARGATIYVDGQAAPLDTIRDALRKDILYERVEVDLTVAQRFRDRGLKDGILDELEIYTRCLTPLEAAQLSGRCALEQALAADSMSRSGEQTEQLFQYYLANFNPEFAELTQALQQLRKKQNQLVNPVPELMVMAELPERRTTYLLRRGAYDAPAEQVFPDVPTSVMAYVSGQPRNRLGLARWLTDPQHPLTARVAVNRYWQAFFGTGIVSTPEDFGSQGALPTQPQLLDWLAWRLIESSWDVKALHKTIVTSATYRQSSTGDAVHRQRDPDNRLLDQAPRFRLPAEMLRDNALAASGLLVNRIGGPPVKPYEPPGLWEEKSGTSYVPDQGEGLYRRSIYTYWKRTSPPPSMMTFDAVGREVCAAKRDATSTPLQALVLLNDPQFTEAARGLAERVMHRQLDSIDQKLEYLFRVLTSRRPEPSEVAILASLYEDQLRYYGQQPAEAEKLLVVGQSAWDKRLDPTQLAATTVVASMLMNLDECVTRR